MATNNIFPLDQLASDLISAVESMVEKIQTSPERAAEGFTADGVENYLYVLYSQQGIPLKAGVVTGSGSKRESNALQSEIQKMASSGLVRSYRTLELGSERLARQVGLWFSSLFGEMLPLAGITESSEARSVPSSEGSEAPAPKRRGRRPGSKGKRAGRPRKQATEASVDSEPVTPTKRRGRPKKDSSDVAVSTKTGRRGRPRKNAVASESSEAPAKRRGRKPKAKTIAASKGTEVQKSRKGRPRVKDADVQNGSGKPKRRRASKGSAPSEVPAKRRGRPRKSESPAPTE